MSYQDQNEQYSSQIEQLINEKGQLFDTIQDILHQKVLLERTIVNITGEQRKLVGMIREMIMFSSGWGCSITTAAGGGQQGQQQSQQPNGSSSTTSSPTSTNNIDTWFNFVIKMNSTDKFSIGINANIIQLLKQPSSAAIEAERKLVLQQQQQQQQGSATANGTTTTTTTTPTTTTITKYPRTPQENAKLIAENIVINNESIWAFVKRDKIDHLPTNVFTKIKELFKDLLKTAKLSTFMSHTFLLFAKLREKSKESAGGDGAGSQQQQQQQQQGQSTTTAAAPTPLFSLSNHKPSTPTKPPQQQHPSRTPTRGHESMLGSASTTAAATAPRPTSSRPTSAQHNNNNSNDNDHSDTAMSDGETSSSTTTTTSNRRATTATAGRRSAFPTTATTIGTTPLRKRAAPGTTTTTTTTTTPAAGSKRM